MGRLKKPAKAYLEMEEAARFEEAATCLRDKIMFRIARVMGLRISEVLGIAVEDIDFEKEQIAIVHEKVRVKLSCPYCGARLAKNDKACSQCAKLVTEKVKEDQERRRLRTMPVDRETLAMIKEYITRGLATQREDRHYLFNITRVRAYQIFRELQQQFGLPDIMNQDTGRTHHISPHRFRDAFGTHAAKVDGTWEGMRLLQELMGHQDIATTAKYRKVAGLELKKFHDKLVKG
jgi:integrase/recombinase XerD